MSREERHGRRSLVFSKWHRLFLGEYERMIDLDGMPYCPRCDEPVALVETAYDPHDRRQKNASVTRALARRANLPAFCALYTIPPGGTLDGCDCESVATRDPDCLHGIAGFVVKRLWPPREPGERIWARMTPEEFRDELRSARAAHVRECVEWSRLMAEPRGAERAAFKAGAAPPA